MFSRIIDTVLIYWIRIRRKPHRTVSKKKVAKKIISEISITKLSPRCASYRRDDLRGVQYTAETISAVCKIPLCAAHRGDNFEMENLGEIETKFENTLACLSGAQIGSNHEKI